MTNPTPHGQVPEALRLADALDLYATGDEHQRDIEDAAAELRRLHYENERLAAMVEAPQPSPTAQAADSVLEDAARWQWLADYLIGERTDLDEGIVACATIDALRQFADAARKQGGAT